MHYFYIDFIIKLHINLPCIFRSNRYLLHHALAQQNPNGKTMSISQFLLRF